MKKKIPVVPTVLLSAAALLLAGSTVGSTRAALTYFSENYSASVNISQIGVSIEENGETHQPFYEPSGYRKGRDPGPWKEI